MPDVSVIIPNYNGAVFLREAIDSVLAQLGVDFELIVVDDGSTDNSGEVIRSFGDRIRAFYQSNRGGSAARNTGLQFAAAAMILFLDSDDALYPGSLRRMVEALSGQGQACSVYGDARWLQEDSGKLLRHDTTSLPKDLNGPAALIGQNLLTGRVLHRIESVRAVGGFDEALPRGQEFDLHFRLALSGVSFHHLPHDVLKYRIHDSKSRISFGGFSGKDPEYLLRLNAKHESILDEYYGKDAWPSSVRVRMAQRLWEIGRGLVREGQQECALLYFEKANQLAPAHSAFGSAPFRGFCRLFGPVRAERLLMLLRSIIRSSDGDG